MEFITVDNTKLKVILSPRDVESLAFSESSGVTENETKAVFRSILVKAKCKTGFSADNCKLFVQCFPSKDGGCELFITKLSVSEDIGKRKYGVTRYILRTHSLENLSRACGFLDSRGFAFRSNVYYDDTTGYCLVLAMPKLPSYIAHFADEAFLSRLGEFGEYAELSNEKRLYIKEHCRLLCTGNAVKVFSKFSK